MQDQNSVCFFWFFFFCFFNLVFLLPAMFAVWLWGLVTVAALAPTARALPPCVPPNPISISDRTSGHNLVTTPRPEPLVLLAAVPSKMSADERNARFAELDVQVRDYHERLIARARAQSPAERRRIRSLYRADRAGGSSETRLGSQTECCSTGLITSICASTADDDGVVVDFDFDPSSTVPTPAPLAVPGFLGLSENSTSAGPRRLAADKSTRVELTAATPQVYQKLGYDNGNILSSWWNFAPYPAFDVVNSEQYRYPNDVRGLPALCRQMQTVATVGQLTDFDVYTECVGLRSLHNNFTADVLLCSRVYPPAPGRDLAPKFVFSVILNDPKIVPRVILTAFLDGRDENYRTFPFRQQVEDNCDQAAMYSIHGTASVFANPHTVRYELVVDDLYFSSPAGHQNIPYRAQLPYSCPACDPPIIPSPPPSM
jgi:hypothetical protein